MPRHAFDKKSPRKWAMGKAPAVGWVSKRAKWFSTPSNDDATPHLSPQPVNTFSDNVVDGLPEHISRNISEASDPDPLEITTASSLAASKFTPTASSTSGNTQNGSTTSNHDATPHLSPQPVIIWILL